MASIQIPDLTGISLRSLLAPGTSNYKDERLDRLRKTFESDQLDPIYGVREISRGRLKIGSRDSFFRGNHAQIGKNEYPPHSRIVGTPIQKDTQRRSYFEE